VLTNIFLLPPPMHAARYIDSHNRGTHILQVSLKFMSLSLL